MNWRLWTMRPSAKRLDRETANAFGTISDVTKRGRFHIAGSVARQFAKNRVLLVGETAHVIPPIGAQGLNLSLRDAALAVELISEAQAAGEDIGARALMKTYDSRRRIDVFPRQLAIDLLNRTLISSFLPFQGRPQPRAWRHFRRLVPCGARSCKRDWRPNKVCQK